MRQIVDDGAGGDLRFFGEPDGDGLGVGHVAGAIGGDEQVEGAGAGVEVCDDGGVVEVVVMSQAAGGVVRGRGGGGGVGFGHFDHLSLFVDCDQSPL